LLKKNIQPQHNTTDVESAGGEMCHVQAVCARVVFEVGCQSDAWNKQNSCLAPPSLSCGSPQHAWHCICRGQLDNPEVQSESFIIIIIIIITVILIFI